MKYEDLVIDTCYTGSLRDPMIVMQITHRPSGLIASGNTCSTIIGLRKKLINEIEEKINDENRNCNTLS